MDYTLSFPHADISDITWHGASLHAHPSAISTDAQFIVMLEAFRPYGGLARWGEFEAIILRRLNSDPASASTWLRASRIFSFEWGGQKWVPLFQLSIGPEALATRTDVARIVDVLQSSHDGWQTASWFVRRATALGGATPLARLAAEPGVVLAAARRASGQRFS